jgi:predicted  nucleic acid-binding Zn-ribbon protein
MAEKRAARAEAGAVPPGEPPAIEALQQRHNALREKKIRAEADVAALQKQLEDARAEARRDFGTDELAALEEKLAALERENLARREEYDAHLRTIEAGLAEVERAHAERPGGGAGGGGAT